MHQQNPVDAPPESRGTTRIRRTPTESCLHLQRDPMAHQLGQSTGCLLWCLLWVQMLVIFCCCQYSINMWYHDILDCIIMALDIIFRCISIFVSCCIVCNILLELRNSGLIVSLHPANERRHYFVTTYLIGWAQTYNQPWNWIVSMKCQK